MSIWQPIWSFETARLRIACEITPEDIDPADHFEFEEDIEPIKSGACDWFIARVRVSLDGREIGADYLGGCTYTNARDFVTGVHRNGYFRDMVREAVRQARRNLTQANA